MPYPSNTLYIGFYTDSARKKLYAKMPAQTVIYSEASGVVSTLGGIEYFNGYLQGVTKPKGPKTFTTARGSFPQQARLYLKNGGSFNIVERTITQGGGTGYLSVTDWQMNGSAISHPGLSGGTTQQEPEVYTYLIRFGYHGKHYIGFTANQFEGDTGSYIPVEFAFEESYWKEAEEKPYDYYGDTEPPTDGGQGVGDMTDTGVHSSPIPSIGIPTGGRGLHLYKISPAGYQSLQSYLWGEGDTIAKSLWQKFQNKTHNPSNSVVACFRLPAAFMPSAGSAEGVQLAGVNLPSTNTYSIADSLYTHAEVTLGTPEQPFLSWLDFSGVTCKIGVPFCGEIAVPAEKVYNKTVTIKYRCDWFNGNIGAAVFADDTIIAELTGNVAYNIPVSGGDTGTLDRIGALAAGALQIAAAETGAAAVAGIATAGAGVAGAQYKTYLNNCNTSGSVSSCANGVAYIEFIIPSTAYPYENSPAYAQAYALPAVSVSGVVGDFAGGYGEFDVCRTADGLHIPNATDAEKEEIFRLLKEGVIV